LMKLLNEAHHWNACAESLVLNKIPGAPEAFRRVWESKAILDETLARMRSSFETFAAVKFGKTAFPRKRALVRRVEAAHKAAKAEWTDAQKNHEEVVRATAHQLALVKPFADIRSELNITAKCYRGNVVHCSEFARGCPDYYSRNRLGETQIARVRRVNMGRPIDVVLGMTLDVLQSKLDNVRKELDRKHRSLMSVRPCNCRKCEQERELDAMPD
jgi:hypothetical protein